MLIKHPVDLAEFVSDSEVIDQECQIRSSSTDIAKAYIERIGFEGTETELRVYTRKIVKQINYYRA